MRRRQARFQGQRPIAGFLTIGLGLLAAWAGAMALPGSYAGGNIKASAGCLFLVMMGIFGIVLGVTLWRGSKQARRHRRRMRMPRWAKPRSRGQA